MTARVQPTYERVEGILSVVPQITGVGFASADDRVLVMHESDLTGRAAVAAGPKVKVPARRRNAVDPLQAARG
ncbi:hypothetical protein GCM10025876_12080 [Demequina litorisediminis]|uniref:Uncharacterized protein n=1 Tax=Demequina litorisediminis TaxID=1849022 RepID=A0ABQ6IB26_9MICO|nr:hypothetical protein GCM10025876_12080 [Demequina litorisediminis]